jgi:maleate isomerase
MKFGVVIPSTNTMVEWDFWRMILKNNIDGIGAPTAFPLPVLTSPLLLLLDTGFHMSGLLVNAPKLATDEDMLNFLTTFRSQLFNTVDALMTAEPEYIIMGMSLETFFGGWEGNLELKNEIKDRSGLSVATGAEACKAALTCFKAKNISVITPYQEIGDKNVVKFFEEIGYNVVRIAGLKCGSATDIAHVPEESCEDIIRNQLVQPGVDCIIQCGTNLSMVALSDRLEKELGLPIIPINVACLWFAMRENGFTDKLDNCSRLFREF